jgi:hypothetical protein
MIEAANSAITVKFRHCENTLSSGNLKHALSNISEPKKVFGCYWTSLGIDTTLELNSLNLQLPLTEVYDKVTFD